MNEYMNALTNVIIEGVLERDEDACKAARARIRICKARNAVKLERALISVGALNAPVVPAIKAAPVRKARKAAPVQDAPVQDEAAPVKASKAKDALKPRTPAQVKAALKRGTITDSQARRYAWLYKCAYWHTNKANLKYDDALVMHGITV